MDSRPAVSPLSLGSPWVATVQRIERVPVQMVEIVCTIPGGSYLRFTVALADYDRCPLKLGDQIDVSLTVRA